jgi:iron(III) transport system substrate-binding protein
MKRRRLPKRSIIIVALIVIAALPFVLREKVVRGPNLQDVLVVMSPHSEFICDEFALGFQRWYKKKTGRVVLVDMRHPSGTSEMLRYLETVYNHQFHLYWTEVLHRSWSYSVFSSYSKPLDLPENRKDDTIEQSTRRAFLESNVTCGVDVVFGGGVMPFKILEQKGYLVSSDIAQRYPEWFTDNSFPLSWGGDYIRHPQGLWFGSVFSAYGIVYNTDVIGSHPIPKRWEDLTDPVYFGKVALCDPTQSGAVKKNFELIIQEQMQLEYAKLLPVLGSHIPAQYEAVRKGWIDGLIILQAIAANSRYFTDKATKPVLDVASGDCAVGLTADQYGLGQAQNIYERSGSHRFGYVTPKMGSAIEADPVGILRGAPHKKIAELFIEYVLSEEGQLLWGLQARTPGGPERYTLRRSPIRRGFYEDEDHRAYRSDPEINPYENPEAFVYHPSWTMPIYPILHIIVKACFIDPLPELHSAAASIIRAKNEGRFGDAERAQAVLNDWAGFDYDSVRTSMTEVLTGPNPLFSIEMQGNLTKKSIAKYKRAESLANAGR